MQIRLQSVRPPANILIPLERQLNALQLCRWTFLYNETLQQTFPPLLSKSSKRRHIQAFWSSFWGSYWRRGTSVDGSLESPCRVLVKLNWTSFSISYGWDARYKAKCVKTRSLQECVGRFERKFQGEGVVPGEYFFVSAKLDTFLLSDSPNCTVPRAVVLTQYRRVTDRQTDGRTELL